jgi:uncharacterized glyoxalase superfamily metalloenzyme YdcJ
MIELHVNQAPAAKARPRELVAPDEIRSRFAKAISAMYRAEVPQYGTLLDLVAEINAQVARRNPASLPGGPNDRVRLQVERHGAVRLGTARELSTLRRMFAVMGMLPVGYYDLSVAGVPVHSTAFRPVAQSSLAVNPFRVFTSLLRLDLIADPDLRQCAAEVLRQREIFSRRALELTDSCEGEGGLTDAEADEFVLELLHTFRWHETATVDRDTYERLHNAHRLVADVVCFRGPHINHLTPRTLDIDAAQAEMPRRGILAKEVIEGPPARRVPILLRQTSFKALEEAITFADGDDDGAHTARFGEIEQRGLALTRKGRALYDRLLEEARSTNAAGTADPDYPARLERAFAAFPDDLATLRREGLGFFRYTLSAGAHAHCAPDTDLETLVEQGIVDAAPITYEDFLPVSAAGIFQSNLGGADQKRYSALAQRREFEQALGAEVLDEIALYEAEEAASIAVVREQLRREASE